MAFDLSQNTSAKAASALVRMQPDISYQILSKGVGIGISLLNRLSRAPQVSAVVPVAEVKFTVDSLAVSGVELQV